MAGAQITVALTQLESQRFGYHSISLTNLGSTAEPEIAAGSKVEIGGALFNFAAPESITGWGGIANDSVVWIKLVVAGAAVTAVFTTTAPTWSTSKQGWYSGLDRYIAGLYKDGSALYAGKHLLECRQTVFVRSTELIGYQAVSLTNLGNLNAPDIGGGSRVEVGGALYYFPDDVAIEGLGGLSSSADAWVTMVPTGMTLVPTYSEINPTWSHAKQGWYNGDARYVAYVRKHSHTSFYAKNTLPTFRVEQIWFPATLDIYPWDMDDDPTGFATNWTGKAGDEIKICSIQIWTDGQGSLHNLEKMRSGDTKPAGGWDQVSGVYIGLERTTGGYFDSITFDSEAQDPRGYAEILFRVL